MRRVAITGVGVINCFGGGKAATTEALRSARSGVRTITSIDPAPLNCRIAGEVPQAAHEGQHRGFDRFSRFALIAAAEAAAEANVDTLALPPHRIGSIIGTGLGGCETLDAGYKRMYGEGSPRIPPTSIAASMYNAAASAVATKHQAKGPSYAVVSACASGTHAIGLAAAAIRTGAADAMYAGGADAPLTYG